MKNSKRIQQKIGIIIASVATILLLKIFLVYAISWRCQEIPWLKKILSTFTFNHEKALLITGMACILLVLTGVIIIPVEQESANGRKDGAALKES